MVAAGYDTEWLLAAYRGENTSDDAAHATAVARATPDLVARWPEAVDALAEGDRRWPDDERRFAAVDIGPPPVEVDPATSEAFDRLAAANGQRDHDEGVVLLDEVALFLGRYVAFPSAGAQTTVALWVVHAHMVPAFESTPRLALLSPEPGSGKTRVLEVVELLTPRPQHVLNASTAAIFRMIEASRPTLLFDEVDTIFGRKAKGDDSAEDLRGLLNAGHRRSATIPRCVGPLHKVEHFPVYAACALAGLGDLPDTLMTRSVVVRMRRRAPTERIESFRRRVAQPEGHELRDALAEWAERVADACGEAWPDMPPGVVDRPADVWEPLLAIADAAGGHWPKLAREACVELTAAHTTDDLSLGVRLLGDIRAVFGADERLATVTILERLVALDEAPWGDWYGKPIDARWLAKHLKPYGASSRQIRMGDTNVRGYHAADLLDAWSRYLPESATSSTDATPQVTATRDVAAVVDVALFPSEDGKGDR